MSMNLMLRAFRADEIMQMLADHTRVDCWVLEEKRSVLETDVGNAWEILHHLMEGAGIRGDHFLDNVLFNGCELIEAATVKKYAAQLDAWTAGKLLAAFQAIKEDADLYHLEYYQDEPEDLVEEFEKLADFYRQAAGRGLGVLHYLA